MHQNKLFNQTRFRLALWYASVMGIILSLSGLGVYRAIAHAHMVTLDRELKSVAGTLHDSLELKLKQPGRIEPIVFQLLPDVCVGGESCFDKADISPNNNSQCAVPTHNNTASRSRHILSVIGQGNYYLRLLDLNGCLVAFAGQPPKTASPFKNQWQIVQDEQGDRYHQFSLLLHTDRQQDWGYMQVGRSFQEFDDYLATVRWVLFLGLPIAIIAIGGSSWWLAGLAMQPIYQSYQQVQQFTADAAHELRTPLAATQATVESAIRMPQLEEQESREILTTIERQNRRLTTLVQDLLLLSRLDQQTVSLRYQSCYLNDLISDLEEEFSALAFSANVKLRAMIQVKQPLYVVGDLDQLYRLVSNIIVNAIQYTPAEGKVEVILDRSDHQALIKIQDTGIGIAPDQQKRIFDRFYRVNSDRSRHTGGSGLGLAIAQAIVRSHHGSIQIQSELGKGSIFTISLPLEFSLVR